MQAESSTSSSTASSTFSYIQAVTFDLDDTLWDAASNIARARCAFANFLSVNAPSIAQQYDGKAFFDLMNQIAQSRPEISHNYTVLREEALRRVCHELGEDPERLIPGAMIAWHSARNNATLFPSVLPLLERLYRKGIKIGVITNGNADVTQNSELRRWVHFSIRAEDVGAAKPHRSIFDAAAQAANVPHSAIVHIGDDYHCDVLGAKQSGMRTVWIHKKIKDMTMDEIDSLRSQAAVHADEIIHDVELLESVLHPWLPPESSLTFESQDPTDTSSPSQPNDPTALQPPQG